MLFSLFDGKHEQQVVCLFNYNVKKIEHDGRMTYPGAVPVLARTMMPVESQMVGRSLLTPHWTAPVLSFPIGLQAAPDRLDADVSSRPLALRR